MSIHGKAFVVATYFNNECCKTFTVKLQKFYPSYVLPHTVYGAIVTLRPKFLEVESFTHDCMFIKNSLFHELQQRPPVKFLSNEIL